MITVTRAQLEASICRDSFFDFFLRFWPVLVPEKLVPNWHIKYLCDELQIVAERVFRREHKLYDLVVNISPGSTKSTICSELFPAWCWVRDQTIRGIYGSYGLDLSLDLASRFHRVVSSDKYRELFPEVVLGKEAMSLIQNSKGGERVATSTGGRITGMHGHIIVIDDPLNPKDAVSDPLLNGANTWLDHTLMSRMVDKQLTPVILIMQRLHQNDPTAHMLEKQSGGVPIRHICLPAELGDSPEERNRVRPRSLRARYVGGLFDPVRLPVKVLRQTAAEMGTYAFAGQYGQHPVPAGGGMFRTDMLRIIKTAPVRWRNICRYWDKAGTISKTGKPKGAFTVGLLMGLDNDRTYWVLDVVRGQWEAAERERIILQTATRDGRKIQIYTEQEPGSGGKESAQQTIKNLAGYRIRVDRPVGDKILRADPYAVQVNGGNVRILEGVWNGAYLAELQFFPFSKYKDQVDASSGAFAMLTGKRFVAGGLSAMGAGGVKPFGR